MEKFIDLVINDEPVTVRASIVGSKVIFELFLETTDYSIRQVRALVAELIATLEDHQELKEFLEEHGVEGQPVLYFDRQKASNLFPFAEWELKPITPVVNEEIKEELVIEPLPTKEETEMENQEKGDLAVNAGKFKFEVSGWKATAIGFGFAAAAIGLVALAIKNR